MTMPTSRVTVILYAFAATAHVMATAAGPASLAWATAPLLMPLLIGVVIFTAAESGQRPDRWLLAGLALATVADVASLAGPSGLRVVGLAGCLACYAAAAVAARRWAGLAWGLGLALLVLSESLLAVRLRGSADVTVPAVMPMLAYVLGQVLVVTDWTRRPISSPRVPRPRTPEEVLTRR
jgi:hypothetical protein